MLKDGEAKVDQPITATLTWDEWRLLHLAAACLSVRSDDPETGARFLQVSLKTQDVMAGVERE